MTDWLILRCIPASEQIVQWNITQTGVNSWIPTTAYIRRMNRSPDKRFIIRKPIVSGLILVQCNYWDLSQFMQLPHVVRFDCFPDGNPVMIPDSPVDQFRKRLDAQIDGLAMSLLPKAKRKGKWLKMDISAMQSLLSHIITQQPMEEAA